MANRPSYEAAQASVSYMLFNLGYRLSGDGQSSNTGDAIEVAVQGQQVKAEGEGGGSDPQIVGIDRSTLSTEFCRQPGVGPGHQQVDRNRLKPGEQSLDKYSPGLGSTFGGPMDSVEKLCR